MNPCVCVPKFKPHRGPCRQRHTRSTAPESKTEGMAGKSIRTPGDDPKMAKDKVRVGWLVQGTIRAGSHTSYTFNEDGEVIDGRTGKKVKTKPLRDIVKARIRKP